MLFHLTLTRTEDWDRAGGEGNTVGYTTRQRPLTSHQMKGPRTRYNIPFKHHPEGPTILVTPERTPLKKPHEGLPQNTLLSWMPMMLLHPCGPQWILFLVPLGLSCILGVWITRWVTVGVHWHVRHRPRCK